VEDMGIGFGSRFWEAGSCLVALSPPLFSVISAGACYIYIL